MIAKVVTHWTIKAKPWAFLLCSAARELSNFAWVWTSEPVKLIGTVGNGVTFWGLEKVVVNDKPIEKVNISTHAKPRRSL
jgi:hypothetical protein